jgi:hypothetical protein
METRGIDYRPIALTSQLVIGMTIYSNLVLGSSALESKHRDPGHECAIYFQPKRLEKEEQASLLHNSLERLISLISNLPTIIDKFTQTNMANKLFFETFSYILSFIKSVPPPLKQC